ncbi:MAG: ABC transporter permease [Fidelibacterota bacterium]
MLDILKMSFSALLAHKMRAILTTLGITIGVFTVGAITAIIEGLNSSFESQVSMLGSDVYYISRGSWFGGYESWIKARKRKPLKVELAEYITENSNYVSAASPMVHRHTTLKYKEKSIESVEITGVNHLMPIIEGTDIENGRFFTEAEGKHRKNVVVIGDNIRKEFFPDIDPIGENIYIRGHRFTIIGLFEKKGKMLFNDMDNRVQIPYLTFNKLLQRRNRGANIAVKALNTAMLDDSKEEVRNLVRHYRKLTPSEEDDFAINQMNTLIDMYNQMTALLWAVAIGIGSISLVVGGIGVMNIMLVSVAERTREIGIRKSVGATRQKILYQFLFESMAVCSVGVITGLLLATGASVLIQSFSPLAAKIPANWGILGAGVVVVVGLVFGMWPANRAARMDPINALRLI